MKIRTMRVLAHKIYYLDNAYSFSVATIEDGIVKDIRPFDGETEATRFISGAIRLVESVDGIYIEHLGPVADKL